MKAQEEQGKVAIKPEVDAVSELTRKHFEEAFSTARKSVTEADLLKFKEFAQKYTTGLSQNPNGSAGVPGGKSQS